MKSEMKDALLQGGKRSEYVLRKISRVPNPLGDDGIRKSKLLRMF